ncbi:MAG: hypothetical protein PHH00_02950 [Candidatus Nanoarchaeia archaeon]|nr:hypothetical protein [Candidatus Nanoarchaeia archaeon]
MIQILNKKQEQEIAGYLKEQFGANKIPGKLMKMGEERIFLFCGNATDEEIYRIERIVPVERVGFYFAKIIRDEFKLSIEGSQALKDEITRNIFELDKEQAEKWMMGQELNIKTGKRGFLIMKYRDDFLGCGKASEEKIGNFVPKMRRLKNKLN